jgi:hypothetical protein
MQTTFYTGRRLWAMRNGLLILLVTLAGACGGGGKKTPDVSGIKADITINRFDRDFFEMDTTRLDTALAALFAKHPVFARRYFEYYSPIAQDMMAGVPRNEAVLTYWRRILPLYDSLKSRFQNMNGIEKDLEQGFRYMKHYFPIFKIPAVYTTVEGLNPENPEEIYGTVYSGDTLSISLQMYAGSEGPFYDPQFYFDYLRRRFEPEYVVRNAFRTIINGMFDARLTETALVDQMVNAGKRLYVLDHVLPNVAEDIKIGYTKEQLKACYDNEQRIWSHFLNNELLFINEPAMIREYMGENPFTKELGTGTPGNIGAFTGWQIVRKYMNKNRGKGLTDLMQTEARTIFQEAKYKPAE